jgi:site-specific DNA recombinase
LLSVIRSGGIEQLVIHRLDRLSRNLRYFVTLFEELRDHNVTLEIVTAQGLGEAALDKFMLSILASFAEFERDLAASRIAEARAHLKAHGRRVAGAVPFGYEADRHTKQLVVCDEEADAVVRMFRWAESGVTPSVIASYANGLRWITGGGKPWTARQVLAILGNHVYAGLVMHGSRLREGCHKALIDREVYDSVQNVICRPPNSRTRQARVRCRHHVDSPRHTPRRRLRSIDEHAYRAIWTGHSWLLSMSIHGGRPRGVQRSHDFRVRN